MSKQIKDNEKVDLMELAMMEEELKRLKKEQGIEEPKEKGLSRMVSSFFERRDAREAVPLKKKTYILLAIFTGWMGGHRFYAKQWKLGLVYLLLCWTGFGAINAFIDLLVVIPKPADESGIVMM